MNGKSYWKNLIPCLGFWARGEDLTPPRARGRAIPRHQFLITQTSYLGSVIWTPPFPLGRTGILGGPMGQDRDLGHHWDKQKARGHRAF